MPHMIYLYRYATLECSASTSFAVRSIREMLPSDNLVIENLLGEVGLHRNRRRGARSARRDLGQRRGSVFSSITTSKGLDMYIGGLIIQTYAGYGTEPISLLGSFKI
ncbi:hypothetical protein AAC387_Pa07g3549 [Persea americana]